MSKLNITLENVSDVVELDTGFIIAKEGFSFTDVVEELTEAEVEAEATPEEEARASPTEDAQLPLSLVIDEAMTVQMEEVPAALSPYTVGDRVRVTTDKYGELQQDDIGFVTAINSDRPGFEVEVDFTKPGSTKKQFQDINDYAFSDLAKIEGFIVGDKVKVSETDTVSDICGQIGTITQDDGTDFFQFRVELEDRSDYDWHQPSDLTFA